jgi:hypothetical protein
MILLFSLMSGETGYARTEKSQKHQEIYKLVPNLGYHLGMSELRDEGNSFSHGPIFGLKFRVESHGYYTAPDFSIVEILGLDKSPATLWSLGLIFGGTIKSSTTDVYFGISTRNFIGYKVSSTVFGRLGGSCELFSNKVRLYTEIFYGKFTRVQTPNIIGYPYIGTEAGLEFPFDL